MVSHLMFTLLLLGGCGTVFREEPVVVDEPPDWLYTGTVTTVRVYGEFSFPAKADGWCYQPWGWWDVDASGTCTQADNVGFVVSPEEGDQVVSGPQTTPLGLGYLDWSARNTDYAQEPLAWLVEARDPTLSHNLEEELGGNVAWTAEILGGPAGAVVSLEIQDDYVTVTLELVPD